MKARLLIISFIIMFILPLQAYAGGKGELQKYFRDTAKKVKLTDDASEKRKILNESFQNLSITLDKVQGSALISKEDRISIEHFKDVVQEKQNELTGSNGYERITDSQLNAFSDYVVQDMEQATATVTISVIALILIILLAVLLF